MNFLCKIGIHKWKQNRPLHIRDIHPGFDMQWETPTRKCLRCKKKEKWLPGYGGSEIGCWTLMGGGK
jgi:hypothetical protein